MALRSRWQGGREVTDKPLPLPTVVPGTGDIRTREGATVVGVVTVLVLVFLLVNLIVDILYGAIDPRIRYE